MSSISTIMNVKNNETIDDGFVEKSQFPGQLPNKCSSKVGSIDVEDLAKFFGDNRQQNNVQKSISNNRVFKNRNGPSSKSKNSPAPYDLLYKNNSSFNKINNYGCQYVEHCYQGCEENIYSSVERQVEDYTRCNNDDINSENLTVKSSTRIISVGNELPLDFGLPCTEDQWLNCQANNCPIYECVSNAPTDTLPNTFDQNGWNLKGNFGPFPPPCITNENPDRDIHRDSTSYQYSYFQSQEQQQFVEYYLSNEKRKEKSRDAARCRRSRETDIFTELARALPLSTEQPAHLDKASVMRLAIAYLKVRSVIDALEEPVVKCPSLTEIDADFPRALDGFMLVLSSNGDMVYLSENVSDYLGVTQMEMMGQSVYEYSHPCDHEELRECLSMKPSDVMKKRPCNFFLRLKCTLTSKGRKVNLKSASYKVIHCIGRAMGICESNIVKIDNVCENSRNDDASESSSKEDDDMDVGISSSFGCTGASLVVVGSPIPHPSNIEIPLGRQTFLSKHSLNMKFTYADERLAEYLGWTSNELLGKSVFEFHHALDNYALDKSFKSLFSKGQCETMAYRFLNKHGGYAWVVTQATLIHCLKQHKPISVVCVNHILSGVEREDEVYSERQLEACNSGVTLNSPSVSTIEDSENEESSIIQSLPALSIETSSETGIDDSSVKTDDPIDENDRENGDEKNDAKIFKNNDFENGTLMLDEKIIERPLTVTASIFRSQADITNEDSRKDLNNSLTTKISKNTDNRRDRSTWSFQDKPILEYEPRNNRPQAVTRNVFVPLGLIQDQELSPQYEQTATRRPQTTTASIFAPRTEDMNKGFLTFSEDQPGLTMLKDEPEDLTHLAPTPGDVCVPLEDTPFLSDMLDEFILGHENYCPLLSTEDLPNELPSAELSDSLTRESTEICGSLESSLADSDPFIYRDIPSPCSLSPNLLSPSGVGKSPDQNSLSSRQSPRHNELVDGMMNIGTSTSVGNPITEDEMLMLSINDVIGDEELALRAPYIPMSDQDETLQLLISDDTVMWGPSQPSDRKTKWHQEIDKPISKRCEDSNLARLLKKEPNLAKYNDHGGGLVNPTQIFGKIGEEGNNAGKFERPSKRIHTPISQNITSENKRCRFNDSRLPIDKLSTCDEPNSVETSAKTESALNYNEQSIDICGIVETNENNGMNSYQNKNSGSRLLLQQLMGRDNIESSIIGKIRDTKKGATNLLKIVSKDGANAAASRTENKEKIGFAGDGGGINTSTEIRGKRRTNSVLMNLLVSGCDKFSEVKIPLHVSNKLSSMMANDLPQNQLAGNNDGSNMDFYDEYSIPSDNRSSPFGNYFNGNSMDLPQRCRYIFDT